MSYHSTEPILTEGFITDFLLKLSNEVYDLRVRRGEFDDFHKKREQWNDTLKGLGQPAMERYDNLVTPAFVAYQEVLENCLIRQGILQTIYSRLQGQRAEVNPEEMKIPGLPEAAARLTAACADFVGGLEDEAAARCAAYLKLRRESIDAGRGLCWRCGADLAEGLLIQGQACA